MEWHEIAIISLLYKRKELALEIDDNIFDDPKSKAIFQYIKELHSENELSTRTLSLVLGSEYNKHIIKLRKFLRNPIDEKLILRMLGNKLVRNKILEIIPTLSKLQLDDFSELKQVIKEAESLPRKSEGITMEQFSENIVDYALYKEIELEKFPTPLNKVYLYPGEVGIIQAVPKGGKTTCLVNIASLAIVHGVKVGFWELERPMEEMMERFALRLIGTQDFKKAAKRIKLFGGELVLRVDPYCTPRALRSWCINEKIGMLVVDYFDYIKIRKMKERRFEISEIYQFSRELAKEMNIPVWTASQSVVKSGKKKYLDMADLEEAKIAKAGIASLVVGMSQNEDEKEENVARANIVVSTHGYKGSRLCELDYSKQLWRELKREQGETH